MLPPRTPASLLTQSGGGDGAAARNSRSHAEAADVTSPALSALSASEDGGASFASWPMMRLPPGAGQFAGATFDSPSADCSGRAMGSVGGFGLGVSLGGPSPSGAGAAAAEACCGSR